MFPESKVFLHSTASVSVTHASRDALPQPLHSHGSRKPFEIRRQMYLETHSRRGGNMQRIRCGSWHADVRKMVWLLSAVACTPPAAEWRAPWSAL